MSGSKITIGTPTPTAGMSFSVEGVLHDTGLKLSYADDPVLSRVTPTAARSGSSVVLKWSVASVSFVPFPSGSEITSSFFSFNHAPLSAGQHSIAVTDGTVRALTRFVVSQPRRNSASCRMRPLRFPSGGKDRTATLCRHDIRSR